MNIKILGTRGMVPLSAPYHSRHSGVLIDNHIMLDCGEPEFLNYDPDYIFITHLHPDHAYFVFPDMLTPKTKAQIFAPEKYAGVPITVFSEAKDFGRYTITAIPTEHSLRVVSQAYLIEKDGVRILYTGDMYWIEKKYHHMLKNIDCVITEASFIREGGILRYDKVSKKAYGHTGIPDLCNFFAPFCENIIFMHFGSWFYRAGARDARRKIIMIAKKYGVRARVAYDGFEFSVPSLENL